MAGTEGGTIIDVEFYRESPFSQGSGDGIEKWHQCLRVIELPMGNNPGMIIDEGDQVALAQLAIVKQMRAVHDIRLPHIIGQLRFKFAPVNCCRLLFRHQVVVVKKAIDCGQIQGSAAGRKPPFIHDPYQFRYRKLRHLVS